MAKKRPTIAFFLAELEGDYANLLCKGAVAGAEEHDVNLVLLPGKALNSPYNHQDQYNVIYYMINHKNVDAIILPSSIYKHYLSDIEFQRFYQSYLPLPMVSLSIPLPETSNIIIDGQQGLVNLLNHLIQVHGCKRIAFIQGRAINEEAEARYRAYQEALKLNGLPFNPQLVSPGDYTKYSAVEAMKLLMDQRKVDFDALVAANDEMALTALSFLHERGISVPQDVAVAGYDDVEGARFSNPPLSTVKFPIYEMGRDAVGMALRLVQGHEIETISMGTEAVIRESCGCNIESSDLDLDCGKIHGPKDLLFMRDQFIFEERHRVESLSFSPELIGKFISDVFLIWLEPGNQGGNYDQLVRDFKEIVIANNTLSDDEYVYIQGLISRIRQIAKVVVTDSVHREKVMDLIDAARTRLVKVSHLYNGDRREHQQRNVQILRDILDGMVSNIGDRDEAVASAFSTLKNLGIRACYIYLYEKEMVPRKGEIWEIPEYAKMVLAYNDEGLDGVEKEQSIIRTTDILSNRYLPKERRLNMILNPLVFLEEQLGFILCEFNLKDNCLYETLFTEMSCVLQLMNLINAKGEAEKKLRDTLSDLQASNEQLSNISQTDDLTGLYNRRGFLNLAGESLKLARQMRKSGLLFYADLDGLKIINDNYGHEEGDYALQQTAIILKRIFRGADILSRLGGDEFTVFTIETNAEIAEVIKSRLHRYLNEYNLNSGKPYRVSISMGAVPFDKKYQGTIEQLLSEADSRLYEQKRLKKNDQRFDLLYVNNA